MIPAQEALERLREGNRRYVTGQSTLSKADVEPGRLAELAAGQHPFAVIVGCSDSRVPVEIVFDQGPGHLFVVRVAGNVAGPSVVGSVEFAAAALDTRLVLVLGHSGCGAVQASLADADDRPDGDLGSIVARIRPTVAPLIETGLKGDALLREAVRANVRATVDHLRTGSPVLAERVATGGLRIVGAKYSLQFGRVDFFDEAE
jgi:carbonic anhydrase